MSKVDSSVQSYGTQTVGGKKNFTVVPSAPAPSAATDLVNKGYVDTLANQLRGEFQKISETTVTNIINVKGGELRLRYESIEDIWGTGHRSFIQLYLAGKFQNEVNYESDIPMYHRPTMGNNG
ncbi:hypothetical protein C3H57_04595 [Campylobacter jejuni]|uniref:Uncharacterized protein n=1 Tax=Campylobacter jejuni TaxID=197 RepID=A0A431EEG4_CAMJU|nr:hypothetical protein C3H57_04595 [Campylobacter jejuni]